MPKPVKLSHRELNNRNLGMANSTFKKGIVSAIHVGSWTADVAIVGNNQTIIKGLPISCALGLHDIKVGDRCRIDVFDETNPQSDMILAYTYGRARYTKANSGFTTVPGNSSDYAIPHGLPGIPNIVSVSTFPGTVGSGGGQPPLAWNSTDKLADVTNIYVSSSGSSSRTIYWAAAIVE